MSERDLFAGLSVSDLEAAKAWYARLLGGEPAFLPNEVEAVWELAEHRYLYIDLNPERAGHGHVTVFLEDFDTYVADVTARGVEPAIRETYDNGVRKWTYRDPDGNEIGLGGAPVAD
jgi:catechol 2,3-dioxygenase-like lactoylglutathione lyase family enzyme